MTEPVSRRTFLAGLGATAVGAAVAGAGVGALAVDHSKSKTSTNIEPFYGDVQSGIVTEQQDRLCFASFDITSTDRTEVQNLLQEWTTASALMCKGLPTGPIASDQNAPPQDTGEAYDLSAARLTLTFGFGPSFFDNRFSMSGKRPAALVDIPPFHNDQLEADRSGGDICVQACADDPQVAFHAVRNLARIGRGVVVMRWNQLGFGRTATTSKSQSTPRNLMGMKDGTNNLRSQDTSLLNDYVWAQAADGSDWMHNGSYLVARRIRMLIEVWDRSALNDQEQTIGRTKKTGAPLGKTTEFDTVDLSAKAPDGQPEIPLKAHIRLAAPSTNDGEHILRRGYSFTDGITDLGQLDAGLFFIAYQRDPRRQFIPIQQKLSQNDALNEYIEHTSSAIFAVPPGIKSGGYIGQSLFS